MLKTEQNRLYALLPTDARCFVRVCDDDRALWVSDLPRRMADCRELAGQLYAAGFAAVLDAQTKLWYLDWTEARWQEMLAQLPQELPALPQHAVYHETYALCRLLLLHPADRSADDMPMIRRLLKLTAGPEPKLLRSVCTLHGEAAARLRQGRSVSCDAGRILAAWLSEHANGKENEP